MVNTGGGFASYDQTCVHLPFMAISIANCLAYKRVSVIGEVVLDRSGSYFPPVVSQRRQGKRFQPDSQKTMKRVAQQLSTCLSLLVRQMTYTFCMHGYIGENNINNRGRRYT